MTALSVDRTLTLVIDTETTGLPPRLGRTEVSPRNSNAWARCRLVQVAWLLFDSENGAEVSRASHIINPAGEFTIPEQAARIHGITDAVAAAEGVHLSEICAKLENILPRVETIVAHNMAFDHAVVASELWRAKQHSLHDQWVNQIPFRYCTMLQGCRRGEKWPRLYELYQRVLGKVLDPATLHRADADAAACAEIYWKMIESRDSDDAAYEA